MFVKITKWIEIFMKLARDLHFRAADNLYAADTVEEAIQLIRDHTSQNTWSHSRTTTPLHDLDRRIRVYKARPAENQHQNFHQFVERFAKDGHRK